MTLKWEQVRAKFQAVDAYSSLVVRVHVLTLTQQEEHVIIWKATILEIIQSGLANN